jgi:hypothetical protein
MWTYLSTLGLWAVGIAIETTGVRIGSAGNVLPAAVAKLLGDLSLLFALGVYARHVILHAQGLLPTCKRRRAKEKPARNSKTVSPTAAEANAEETAAAGKPRTDLQPHIPFRSASDDPEEDSQTETDDGPSQTMRQIDEAASHASSEQRRRIDSAHDAVPSDDSHGKLSKAERKRLRKLKAQEEQGW